MASVHSEYALGRLFAIISWGLRLATKAELQSAAVQHQLHVEAALAKEADKQFGSALDHCELAWQYVNDMMSYKRKHENVGFKNVPCIDLALRLAPLVLRSSTLDALDRVLKEQRSIDKHATDDLAARLTLSRNQLNDAYRAWDLIERNPGQRQDKLRELLGGVQDNWRWLAERWETMGIVERAPESNSYRLWMWSNLEDRVQAKCPACGAVLSGPKRAFLIELPCPSCSRFVVHVILGPPERLPLER
jgi:hypothetical protein